MIRQLSLFFRENQEATGVRVFELIFNKHLIQTIPLNNYMRFNLNDLKVSFKTF